MSDVVDRDLGQRAIFARLAEADGLQVRVGVLSGVPKYPKDRGGTAVAKVAAVHGLVGAFGDAFDKLSSERQQAIVAAHAAIVRGVDPAKALERVSDLHRDAYRREVRARGLVATGKLLSTVVGAVFDGSKRVAGDNPRGTR